MNKKEIIIGALKSHINMNLKSALLKGLNGGVEDEKGYLPIIIEEFLSNPLYVEFLVSLIAEGTYNRFDPQLDYEEGLQQVCDYLTLEVIAKRAISVHPLAYQDIMNIRRFAQDEKGTTKRR